MSLSPGSPVTGAAITGFTSPTYTITADAAPAATAKQWAVTSLGGTQSGVNTHSVSSPFTFTSFKPASVKIVGAVDPKTGQLAKSGKNTYSWIFRKGMVPLAGQAPQIAVVRISADIPAGCDLAAPAEIKALFSFLAGIVWANVQAYVDLALTNTQ